jgi:polyphosphate kinase 2
MNKKRKEPDLLDQAAIELVKLQKHVIAAEKKLLIIVEGRDGAGKDGLIKRVTKHMSPRETRVVALGKPSDRDRRAWYFERWVSHLPVGGEIVFFNRSWYNRAGVERVMGFCTEAEAEEFPATASLFEQLLAHCGVTILKYYLDISKGEQRSRLAERHDNPLKQWKLSPVDDEAIKRWKAYSQARNEMFARTHTVFAPWIIVRADDKKEAQLNVMRDLLTRMDYDGKRRDDQLPNPNIVFLYDPSALSSGLISP